MSGNRFGKIEATIVSSGRISNLDWITAKDYLIGEISYSSSDGLIRCISSHTSGTYATDKATKWKVIDGLPLGAVIPIYNTALTGAYSVPNTGVVDSFRGLMRADGAVIPGSNQISGTTPNLSDSRFLMGSTASGTSGGANTNSHTHSVTSNVSANIPGHNHSSAATGADINIGAITTGTESANHTHNPLSGYNSAIGSGGVNVVAMVNGTTFTANNSNVSAYISMPTQSALHTHSFSIAHNLFAGRVGLVTGGSSGGCCFCSDSN